jgi:hypothetical protein
MSNSFHHRKAFITFCVSSLKVLSFRKFKEFFLDHYIKMAKDSISEVQIHFLNSAVIVRPYIEQDLDLLLQFNTNLSMLRLSEKSSVS